MDKLDYLNVFYLIAAVLMILFFIIICGVYFQCLGTAPDGNRARGHPDYQPTWYKKPTATNKNAFDTSPLFNVIGTGFFESSCYTILQLKVKEEFIVCKDKMDAYQKAKWWGHGAEPLYHDAHLIGGKDHYHIHGHYYIQTSNDGDLLNKHFTFGPPIEKDVFSSRKLSLLSNSINCNDLKKCEVILNM